MPNTPQQSRPTEENANTASALRRVLPVVDYFVDQTLSEADPLRLRQRVLAASLLFITSVCGLGLAYFFFRYEASSFLLQGGAFFAPVALLFNIACLAALKLGVNYRKVMHFTLIAMSISTYATILISGGPLHGNAIPLMLAMPPVLAYLIGGSQIGAAYGAFAMALLLGGAIADQYFIDFPKTVFLNNTEGFVISTFITFFGLLVAVATYERSHSQLSSSLQSEQEKLQAAVRRDPLTGVDNRLAFYQDIQERIAEQLRFKLYFIDLNSFKAINDDHGHLAGDHTLSTIAQRLQRHIEGRGKTYRIGGDEFVLLVDNRDNNHRLSAPYHLMAAVFDVPVEWQSDVSHSIKVEGNIGVASYPEDGSDADTLQHIADNRMYGAKEAKVELFRQRVGTDPSP